MRRRSKRQGQATSSRPRAFSSSAHIGAFCHRAVSRVLGTLSRRQDDCDERGIASCDRRKHYRAAQELQAQAPTSAHSAIGPYQACSARCRAAKMILASAASLQATRASSVNCSRALSSSAHIGAFGHGAVSSVLGTPSRRQDAYDERDIASCDKGKLHRAVKSVLGTLPRRQYDFGKAASLQATRATSVELPKSFRLSRPHRRIRPCGHSKRAGHAVAPL